MDLRAGLRRTPPDDRPLPPSDAVLVERIRAEIAATGPMTFARFMELALTDPGHGYYTAPGAPDRPTREGDFLTAPELHPIFGWSMARQLDQLWRFAGEPPAFVVREYGAGAGTLALAVLDGLEMAGSGLAGAVRWEPVEVALVRRRELEERFAAAGRTSSLAPIVGARPRVGCILANEFLDALPVHRVVRRGAVLRELFVTVGEDGLAEMEADPSSSAIARRLEDEGIVLADGQRAEVCLAIDPWADEMSGALDRGWAIVVDYGRPAEELYGPSRRGGTLRAYSGQRAHADPLVAVGRQDITTHVDFTAVERAAARQGWTSLGLTTQAAFLVGSGLGELLAAQQADPRLRAGDHLELRSAVMRLLDPRALGAFRVLILARGVPTDLPPAGLGLRAPGRP